MNTRQVAFARLALNLTAVEEVGLEMTRLAGDGAQLLLRSTRAEPVPVARLAEASPADLDHLTMLTVRRNEHGGLQEGPGLPFLPGPSQGDPFAWITVHTQGRLPGGGSLRVVCGDAHRLEIVTTLATQFLLRLGSPRPNTASRVWWGAGAALAVLWVPLVLAAVLGVLDPLLWVPTIIVAVVTSAVVVRWAKPLQQRIAGARDVVIIDPTPRREVLLARANHRRDARVAVWAFLAGAVVALIPSAADLFGGK